MNIDNSRKVSTIQGARESTKIIEGFRFLKTCNKILISTGFLIQVNEVNWGFSALRRWPWPGWLVNTLFPTPPFPPMTEMIEADMKNPST